MGEAVKSEVRTFADKWAKSAKKKKTGKVVPMVRLSEKFLNKYKDFPSHMNALGQFVYLRTYSRYMPEEGRRETWKETCTRASQYNVSLAAEHLKALNIPISYKDLEKECEFLFDNMFNLRQFLSGRTLWVGGADNGVADLYPLANFNCSFTNIENWEDLAQLFYLLLVGTGVGFKSTKKMARNMPKVKTTIKLVHKPYEPEQWEHLPKLEDTMLVIDEANPTTAEIRIGDSKEGWVDSLRFFFEVLSNKRYAHIETIYLVYDYVRPIGTRLKTFGGTASGPQPLMEMFQGFDNVLKNKIDPYLAPIEIDDEGYGSVRPIHILDMGNLVGNNVVVGGVRRTAEIFLFDHDDWECVWAKYGVNGFREEKHFKNHERVRDFCVENGIELPPWFDELGKRNYDGTVNCDWTTGEPNREADGSLSPFNFSRPYYHRGMSNNSVAFVDKPSRLMLSFLFQMMQGEGEPGFINLYEAARRRLAMMGIYDDAIIREYAEQLGLNPCAEILLRSKGVCNLTTVNVKSFVYLNENTGLHELDRAGLLEAQRLSARSGLRMTLVQLELPEWDEVQKTDRLTGTSVTGWKDAIDLLGFTPEQERELAQEMGTAARAESDLYAKHLRVTPPLLVDTIKPEGTLSQVAGGVSPGLHQSHAMDYIRRIRISAQDALAKTVRKLGWRISPENGTPGATREEKLANARTIVVDFPIHSGSLKNKEDITVEEQFETYFMFQEAYTEHNSSNTITIKPHEWEIAEQIIWDNWENFVGVSFLSLDGGTYQLAPYETCTAEEREALEADMLPFSMFLLNQFDNPDGSDLDGAESCEGGACGIR